MFQLIPEIKQNTTQTIVKTIKDSIYPSSTVPETCIVNEKEI